jgi:hypothetical protein
MSCFEQSFAQPKSRRMRFGVPHDLWAATMVVLGLSLTLAWAGLLLWGLARLLYNVF